MLLIVRYITFLTKWILVFIFVISNVAAIAQDTSKVYDLGEEIVVSASRVPTAFKNTARSVTLIDQKTIAQLPVNSLQEVLQYIPSVDLRQRGPAGVQADVSIRGGSFEQTLILIDGFRVSDPQSGHHNLNIPTTLQNVKKIEVLRGPGSRFYGPNALGGVINIITNQTSNPALQLQIMSGEYGLYRTGAALQLPAGNFSHRISLEKSGGNGYRPATDFDNWSAEYSGRLSDGNHQAMFSLSHIDKNFGAGGFYSAKFPNQWERTKTTMLRSQYKYQGRRFNISPRLFWRKNKDKFLLDRSYPEFYQNDHLTDVYGLDMQAEYISSWGISGLGAEISREQINSSNLGDRRRDKAGLFFEQQISGVNKLNIVLGLSTFYYSNWGWKSWPGIDVNYQVLPGMSVYGSINQAFRTPTFTEMYYTSPIDKGNPQLLPEESLEYEIGLSGQGASWNYTTAIFYRQGKNLIDWARIADTEPWQAMNITNMNMKGFEFSYRIALPQHYFSGFFKNLQTAYTYLKADQTISGYQSKYALNYLRNQALASISHSLFLRGLQSHWQIRYEDRVNGGDYWLTDLKITYNKRLFSLFFEATNLLNTEYETITTIPMPGRWLKLGFEFKISFDMTE